MKRTELQRRTPLARGAWDRADSPGKPLTRKSAPKRTQPKRDWSAARAKVEAEGVCRAGHHLCVGKLEAAHIIGRDRDKFLPRSGLEDGGPFVYPPGDVIPVAAIRIVPLCTWAHRAYDRHELDLLGVLTPEEEAQAVLDADGLEAARRRLCPSEYRGVL